MKMNSDDMRKLNAALVPIHDMVNDILSVPLTITLYDAQRLISRAMSMRRAIIAFDIAVNQEEDK